MEYRKLGRTGLRVSAVGLGAWQIGGAVTLAFKESGRLAHGWGRTDDNASLELLTRCREAGVNFIDTAPIYGDGHSERLIGRALRACRDEWIVCTKGGHGATGGTAWHDFSRERLLRQVDESLQRLRMEAVDVYLLHGPTEADLHRGECMEALAQIRSAGKARFVGVSLGPNALGLSLIRSGAVDVLQQAVSLANPGAAEQLLPAAAEAHVGVIARGVFGAGFLTGAVTTDTVFREDDRRSRHGEADKKAYALHIEQLRALTGPHRSPAQLAVQYALALPGVSTVIAGSTNWTHMAENIGALAAPALTREDLEMIRKTQPTG